MSERTADAMTKSELEVFVLTYNRAELLNVQLESIYRQSLKHFSVIVLDNASTDSTSCVIDHWRTKFETSGRSFRHVRHVKNIGNPGNFRYSQQVARARFCAIFHDDDAIHPMYLERALKILRSHPNVVCVTGDYDYVHNVDFHNFAPLSDRYFMYSSGLALKYNLEVMRPAFFLAIYRTDAYKKVEYRDDLYGKLHDNIFLMELNKLGDLAFVMSKCGRWGCSQFQDSNKYSNGPFVGEILNILVRMGELLKGENPDVVDYYALWCFAYFLWNWSKLSRFNTWEEFSGQLFEVGVFAHEDKAKFNDPRLKRQMTTEISNRGRALRERSQWSLQGDRPILIAADPLVGKENLPLPKSSWWDVTRNIGGGLTIAQLLLLVLRRFYLHLFKPSCLRQ